MATNRESRRNSIAEKAHGLASQHCCDVDLAIFGSQNGGVEKSKG